MIYTPILHKAFHYSILVHETHQKQKRKGKDIPYVTHPIHVGVILAKAGASDDVIAAGFLHDTIEDSTPEHKVTKELLASEFNPHISELVFAVSEKNKELPWRERKEKALEEIRNFSHDALLLKSGDVVSNVTELLSDVAQDGNDTFLRFNSDKDQIIWHATEVIKTILDSWSDNPLREDLIFCLEELQHIT